MHVFDRPARVTVETGGTPAGVFAVLAAAPALAAVSAVAAFTARYAVVLAVIALVATTATAAFVRVLYRRWTVLAWRTRVQRSRADTPPPAVMAAVRPAQITAPARRALPAPASTPAAVQRPATGIRRIDGRA